MLEILKAAQGDEPTSCGNVVPVIRKARSRGEDRYHFDKRQTSRRAVDSTDKIRAGTLKGQRSKHGPDQETAERSESNDEASDLEVVAENFDIPD